MRHPRHSPASYVAGLGWILTALACGNPAGPVAPPDWARCLERARFGDPSQSPYRLPYKAGEAYVVSQSYCFPDGGHDDQLAYDFDMPIGADILAIRDGVVRSVREDSPDDGLVEGAHNFVYIEHRDGTTAFYAHLMQDGVDVEVGDAVAPGDRIAASGNSGRTGNRPHLHLGVYRTWPVAHGDDVPLNFSNAAGEHDARGGLQMLQRYTALPTE